MANTPGGLPYPVGTDKVVDGDDAIKALALALDRQHILVAMNTDANGTATIAHALGVVPGQAIWNFETGMDQATFLVMGPVMVFSRNAATVQLRFTRSDTHGFLVSGPIRGTLTVIR